MERRKHWSGWKACLKGVCLLLCVTVVEVRGGERWTGGLEEFLAGIPGKVSVNSRVRYEVFDQAGGLDVDGISHRIRYGYETESYSGFTAMVEGETVYAWGHGQDLHPADNAGDGTDLNQMWIAFQQADYGMVKVGRQVYTLDDHRFIGHVGWRQNIQSFDAATGTVNLQGAVRLKAFFIDAVNSVTGSHNDIEAWGLNAGRKINEFLEVTAFLYSIEGRPDVPAGSGDTAGIRFAGKMEQEEFLFSYTLAYARQWENSGNTDLTFGHDYWSLDTSLSKDAWTLGFGFESLGGDGIHGFSTPLATLHKFNGFADVFLAASAAGGLVNGLDDLHLRAEYLIPAGKGLRLSAIHHWFTPRRGAGDYGNEIDLVASYALSESWSFLGKYGQYSSEGGSGGVGGRDKEMLALEVNFTY